MPEGQIEVFDRDARTHGGYVYTTSPRLSSRMAVSTTIDAILESGVLEGRSVLDMGCGDGFYTTQIFDRAKPRSLAAFDAATGAVQLARASGEHRPIRFAVGDVYRAPWRDDAFDVVLLQSILHHIDHPAAVIREAFRLAPEILIHEPNGNNFGLKVIEKVSPYHRSHGEKSYASFQLARDVRRAGGIVTSVRFYGFVPMFSPDPLAKAMKAVEPLLERIPLLRAFLCSVYVLHAARADGLRASGVGP